MLYINMETICYTSIWRPYVIHQWRPYVIHQWRPYVIHHYGDHMFYIIVRRLIRGSFRKICLLSCTIKVFRDEKEIHLINLMTIIGFQS